MMDCGEAHGLLDAYVDNELGAGDAMRLEAHLQTCAACTAEAAAVRALGRSLREHAPYYRAPAALRTRILSEVLPTPRHRFLPSWLGLGTSRAHGTGDARAWLTPALGALCLCAVTLDAVLLVQRPSPANTLAQEVVASHVRALLSEHPIDVASTDQHTVKPWFNGKLDYVPPVNDLAAEGFPLVGGRVDYIGHRRVAVLIYRYQKHPIDLFVFPDARGTAEPAVATRDGYALASWRDDGMSYRAVTDAAPAALRMFARALRSERGQAAGE